MKSWYFVWIFAGVITLSASFIAQANDTVKISDAPTFSWQEACAVNVCRATGHDGAYATHFSPDGKQLLVEVRHIENGGVYIIDTDTNEHKKYITQGNSAAWLPDGKNIIYVDKGDLWSFNITSNKAKQLTDSPGNVRTPIPSPDGKWIAFSSNRSGYEDIWVISVGGKFNPVRVTQGAMPLGEVRHGYAWSPDSKAIAYFSNSADEWSDDLWIVDIDSKTSRQLSDNAMGRGTPSWSPDGQKIAFYGTLKSGYWYNEIADIFVADVNSGESKAIDNTVHARETGVIKWSRDSKEIFFPHLARGEVELWRISSSGGVATRLTHQGGVIHHWDYSEKAEQFAIIRSTPTRGREVEQVPLMGGPARRISQFATPWTGLVEPEEISYRSVDGLYIQGFMFKPANFNKANTYPAIVQVHGGGTHSYYNGLNLVEQRLAQRGYVVFAINYRGGSGFGRNFQDLSTNDWANTQALDAAAAAGYIRAQSWSNGKVGIYGYSYGGITSLAAVTRAPDAFDAAVPMSGIYDFASAYENDNRLIKLFIKYGHSGTPAETPEHYGVSNTIAKLNQVKTPVLLMHGEKDNIAPFNQFKMARDSLTKYGKNFDSHSYENEPHRFQNPKNRVDMYSRMEAWMDTWLRKNQ